MVSTEVIRGNSSAVTSSRSSRPHSLHILPDESSLRRRGGPFAEPLPTLGTSEDQPRALRALAKIIEGGLCHRCGTCIGICPTAVLGLDDEDYPRIDNLSACTDCDLCVRVCPGDEFNVQKHHQALFGAPTDLTATHGSFRRGVVAYASDLYIREHSTSGGVATALLVHLLESGAIDGAMVIGSDPQMLWKGKAMVARNRGEILAAMKSKYAISPTNITLSEIRERPGRYALVGLPCQIHGFLKAAELDSRIAERVVLTIGLFCHAAIEHEALRVIWDTLGDKTKGAKRFISRVGKHPGTPHLELADGSLYPVYFGSKKGYRPSSIEVINVLYRLYTPVRCTTCFDALSDYADISVGDPWMAPPENYVNWYDGWSFAVLRTERGEKLYDQAVHENKLVSLEVTRREVLASNRLMATEKHWRAFRVLETHRRQGKPIPSYGDHTYQFPAHLGVQFLKTEVHMLTHLFCFLPRYRAAVLRFFLGNGGYVLFWLNSRRRACRVWLRDTVARLRRSVWGRR